MSAKRTISIIGLGYVGLPLAIAFAKHFKVIGYDKNITRINELKKYSDVTNEISHDELQQTNAIFTTNSADLKQADFHIVAVPTPIDASKKPDLTCLLSATKTVAEQLKKNGIVVYESTVYPGTTEELCIPILEKISHLKCHEDFSVGYSPERINPGDKAHSFENILKIVSACNEKTLKIISDIYQQVIHAGVYIAPSIRVAEAAKAIENAQRDINIAFMNELVKLFNCMDIDTYEVLKAAKTKWNFLPFEPGLVGGHCIGVDPYYLTFKAEQYNFHPEMILAGRRINDTMGKYIATQTIKKLVKSGHEIANKKIAILGFTFKENCPDIRNSRIIDIFRELENYGAIPIIHDPIANSNAIFDEYGIRPVSWDEIKDVTSIIITVAHDFYKSLSATQITSKLKKNHTLIVDVKGILDKQDESLRDITIWSL